MDLKRGDLFKSKKGTEGGRGLFLNSFKKNGRTKVAYKVLA